MPVLLEKESITATSKSALRALLYFDLFQYPLNLSEIAKYSSNSLTEATLRKELNYLCAQGFLEHFKGFYGFSDICKNVERRLIGNQKADSLMSRARMISRFIGAFPFVRGVGLSGSLSKNFMSEETDIDFFIITKPGRLWIARTFLILFKKLFLLNSYKFFCVNYFIDLDHLEIEEKNKFTALETLTLIPTYGRKEMHLFFEANIWAKGYWSNHPHPQVEQVPKRKKWTPKGFVELVFSGVPGDWFDGWLMHKTIGFWNKKFGSMDRENFDLALKSRKYVSKHHPQNFQRVVLDALAKNESALEKRHDISLN